MRSPTQTKTRPKPSFTPVQTGLLQRKCACGNSASLTGKCSECENKRLTLQRRSTDRDEVSQVPPIVHEVLNSPGQRLDPDTRTFMESRFGYDFRSVRVHTDAKAAQSAQAVNALAYTVGQNIVFGRGQYVPSTREGRQLLAHELTHTIQQSHAGSLSSSVLRKVKISEPSDRHEREADFVADWMVGEAKQPGDATISSVSSVSQTLWRQPIENMEADEDFSEAISEPETAEIGLENEAVEMKPSDCTGSRRLDYPSGIANFDTVDFTVQRPCRRVTVELEAQWECVGCEFGPDSYTISLDRTRRTMPAGNRGIEEECTGTRPRTRQVTFSVSPGSHRLRISTGRAPGSSCRLVISGFLEVRR